MVGPTIMAVEGKNDLSFHQVSILIALFDQTDSELNVVTYLNENCKIVSTSHLIKYRQSVWT